MLGTRFARFCTFALLFVAAALPAAAADLVVQDLSGSNTNAYAAQDFETDYDAFDCFIADDFTVPADTAWSVEEIFSGGGGWNGMTSLNQAESVNCMIFTDDGGVPAGAPAGYGDEGLWTESWAPGDVTIIDNYSFQAVVTTPPVLAAGTYWLSCWARLDWAVAGQSGFLVSDTTNGSTAQWNNPGGGFSIGSGWQDMTVLGTGQTDVNFALYGTILAAPTVDAIDPATGTNDGPVDVTITGTGFVDGDTTVTLVGEAKADISGTDVVVTDETTLTCTFDLTGATAGAYDVAVTTTVGTGTLAGGFTVEEAADDDTDDDDTDDDDTDDDDTDDDDDTGADDDDDDSSGGCGC